MASTVVFPGRAWLPGWRAVAFLAVTLVAATGAGAVLLSSKQPAVRPSPVWAPRADRALAASFATDAPGRAAYDDLFRYLLSGFDYYRDPSGASARLPGERSRSGPANDGAEAFARFAPLLAAWLAGGGADRVTLVDGTAVSVSGFLVQGIKAGTDPGSPAYWGRPKDRDQRIVNAEDIAQAAWLARDFVWPRLGSKGQENVLAWLGAASAADTYDNNWLLMSLTAGEVARALAPEADAQVPLQNYQHVRGFQTGDGWFHDGVLGHWHEGHFDYYNAWAYYYDLYLLDQIDPHLDRTRIRADLVRFADQLSHFISPAGIPIMGRSICYRMAIPAPLVAAAAVDPAGFDPGLARRAMDVVWSHFIQHGALRGGLITQGYYGTDLRLLDNYTGPGGCYMATRSLVLAFGQPRNAPFWRDSPTARLPVEQHDFTLDLPQEGWRVEGQKSTGEIRIVQTDIPAGSAPRLISRQDEHLSLHDRLEELFGFPYRPENFPAKYERPVYSSNVGASPFTN